LVFLHHLNIALLRKPKVMPYYCVELGFFFPSVENENNIMCLCKVRRKKGCNMRNTEGLSPRIAQLDTDTFALFFFISHCGDALNSAD
jgi:hypothetical protein